MRKSNTFSAAYERILEVTSAKTQTQVAGVLGIRQSSIADGKRRGSLPAEWLLTLLKRYSVNPTWIETGEGSKFLVGADGLPASAAPAPLEQLTFDLVLDHNNRKASVILREPSTSIDLV